ncbi:uncharacterized protein BXIN_2980 [Babesia sp. Xinjiang]|uniref:uncharacterized protein n=1 Tax=Babesia sp. Xinjiang TaxID=462227 RepID=UPI000A25B981|nr:uncharacterized protein BXIN_2980 [Babesia sp. Xinjiang]ORM39456.1 hypothetical protein BXIN_2980 [Babesia sp. Xinjiang]
MQNHRNRIIAVLPIRACLFGLLASIGVRHGGAARIFPVANNPWGIAEHAAVYPSADLICHAAGCTSRDTGTSNPIDPHCGSQTVCQECPTPALTTADTCYLSRILPDQVNLMEGHLNNIRMGEGASDNTTSDADDDEGSFLQAVPFEMQFQPSTTETEVKSNKAMCALDKDGTIDAVVRITVQWYKTPNKGNSQPTDAYYEGSMLEITQNTNPTDEIVLAQKVANNQSFLEFFPGMMGKLKNMNPFKKSDDDSSDDGGDSGDDGHHMLMQAGSFAHNKIKRLFTNTKLQIHFSVSHRKVTNCRQQQRWKGTLHGKSMVFTATQHVKITPADFQTKFFKEAIKMNVTCKNCENIEARSCVQITCTKKPPFTRRYSSSLQATLPTSGVMQPSFPTPSPAFVAAPQQAGFTAPPVGHAVPQHLHLRR